MKHNAKLLLVLIVVVLIVYAISVNLLKTEINYNRRQFKPIQVLESEVDPWRDVPSLELVIRTNSYAHFIQLYSTWFLKSLKLFWPEYLMNLTLVFDDERKEDHATGNRLSQMWPKPKFAYRKPGDPSVYAYNQRRRMYLSYFYPEEYVDTEYVGFVDTDTMFTTVVTPNVLFVDGKPTVQARIGAPYYQQGEECWSDVTEYMLGKKEALQCMTYFPVIFKVQHVVEMRRFAEKRFRKPFIEIYKRSMEFHPDSIPRVDCVCQYSIICNYLWYYHRDEYDFHLQMTPNTTWTGEHRRESQQSLEYFRSIDPKYLIPKPRIAIHSQHYMENGVYVSRRVDLTKEPHFTHLKGRLREGLCHSIWFDRCPEKCVGIKKGGLQVPLYSFELFSWTWDNRCLEEQRKHYDDVKKLILYNEQRGRKMFGVKNYSDVCNEGFEFVF